MQIVQEDIGGGVQRGEQARLGVFAQLTAEVGDGDDGCAVVLGNDHRGGQRQVGDLIPLQSAVQGGQRARGQVAEEIAVAHARARGDEGDDTAIRIRAVLHHVCDGVLERTDLLLHKFLMAFVIEVQLG